MQCFGTYIDEAVMEVHAQDARSGGSVCIVSGIHSLGDLTQGIRAAGLVKIRHQLSLHNGTCTPYGQAECHKEQHMA